MRVAVRRARSAMSIFRPAVEPGALDTINDRLRALGRQLGPSRDWDVFADETDSGDPAGAAAATSGWNAWPRRRRGGGVSTGRELTAYLASAEFRKLGIELAWFAAAGSWRTPRVGGARRSLAGVQRHGVAASLEEAGVVGQADGGAGYPGPARRAAAGQAGAICRGDVRHAVSRQGRAPIHPPAE